MFNRNRQFAPLVKIVLHCRNNIYYPFAIKKKYK
jgi:hypothetical protein